MAIAELPPKPPALQQPQQPDFTANNKQFDIIRQQAQDRAQAMQAQNQNALQRRFSAMGGGPQGAHLKMLQQNEQQGHEALGNQIQQINAAQIQSQEPERAAVSAFNRELPFKQQAFDLERGRFDLARRAQAQDEQGQFFNQANTAMASPYSADRWRQEISGYGNYLDKAQLTNDPVYTQGQAADRAQAAEYTLQKQLEAAKRRLGRY